VLFVVSSHRHYWLNTPTIRLDAILVNFFLLSICHIYLKRFIKKNGFPVHKRVVSMSNMPTGISLFLLLYIYNGWCLRDKKSSYVQLTLTFHRNYSICVPLDSIIYLLRQQYYYSIIIYSRDRYIYSFSMDK